MEINGRTALVAIGGMTLCIVLVVVAVSEPRKEEAQAARPGSSWAVSRATELAGPGYRTDAATDSERLARLNSADAMQRVIGDAAGKARAMGRDFTVLQLELAACSERYMRALSDTADVFRERGFARVECTNGRTIWAVTVP